MGKRLFTLAGILAALAVTAAMIGIWTDDVRWFNTCGALSVAFGAPLFSGVFASIGEA